VEMVSLEEAEALREMSGRDCPNLLKPTGGTSMKTKKGPALSVWSCSEVDVTGPRIAASEFGILGPSET
jgi:hypothetical protein